MKKLLWLMVIFLGAIYAWILRFYVQSSATPDVFVSIFVFWIARLLLESGSNSKQWYLNLGLILGFSYLTKTVMFPLAILAIIIFFVVAMRRGNSLAGPLLSTTIF